MFIRSVALVALILVGCGGYNLDHVCIKADEAIKVYEECMAEPSCRMYKYDRSDYIFYKANYRKYRCETRLSKFELED